jgi:hypothetical protein
MLRLTNHFTSARCFPLYGAALYLAIAIAYCCVGPGLGSDEALSVKGALIMTSAPAAQAKLCEAGFDFVVASHCLPLMITP